MKLENTRCKKLNNIYLEKQNKTTFIETKIGFFEIRKCPIKTLNIKENKKLYNNIKKLKEKNVKITTNNGIKNYINNNLTIIIMKLLILINIFNFSKNIKLGFHFFQYSNISLKIKGIGEKAILGFNSHNFPKDIYINGEKQNNIYYKYFFNRTDNYVEIIFDDNLVDCIYMFYDCNSITEINFSNFDTSFVITMSLMFFNCSSLTSLDLSNFNTSQVKFMNAMFAYCSSLTSLDLSNFNTSQVTNMYAMFCGCSSLTSLDLSNFDTSNVGVMLGLFGVCSYLGSLNLNNYNKSQIISILDVSDSCINLEYINLKNIDENNLIFYDFMFSGVSENIVICINTTQQKILSEIEKKSCYVIDCSNDWKSKQKKLIDNSNECFDSCDSKAQYEYKGKCYEMEEYLDHYNNFLQSIDEEFISENFITSNIDNGEDMMIKNEKLTITLTTPQNQRNNININMTKIDLGECEILLRKFYNISDNESLYIKKIDINQEDMKTLKVEYDVYAKLFGKNLIKLNLTACENSKISISIPIIINDQLDKFNISSGYYNDICYTATSEDGTDILLKDRQNEFIDKDKIVCQEDCDFSEYDYDTFVAKCSCKVKKCSDSFADMNINKKKLLENFKNIKSIVNFSFLVCYKKLFNKEGILFNIGFYLLLFIILFQIITIIIFSFKQFSSLKKIILNFASEINSKKQDKKIEKDKLKKNQFNDKIIYINIKSPKKYRKNKNIKIKKDFNESKIKFNPKFKRYRKTKKVKNMKYIDEEINRFSYNLAIQCDKRTYCQYYISLLKTQHNLISALFNNDDYNCGIIKINLFLIGFAIEYTVNAFFYNDDTMHKIYESKGVFDLETQLPIAIYSTIISTILNYPLNLLAFSNDAIINFKQINEKLYIMNRARNLKNILMIKFIFYFIISFLLLIFFWYYISMFCVIYRNTQIHLLKDTLMSFGLSLLIPFVIY